AYEPTQSDIASGSALSGRASEYFRGVDIRYAGSENFYLDAPGRLGYADTKALFEAVGSERYAELKSLRTSDYAQWEREIAAVDFRSGAAAGAGEAPSLLSDPFGYLDAKINTWVKGEKASLLAERGGYGEFAGSAADTEILR